MDQTRSQGLLIEVDHSAVGRVQLPGPSLRFESADGQSQLRDYHDAPPVWVKTRTGAALVGSVRARLQRTGTGTLRAAVG